MPSLLQWVEASPQKVTKICQKYKETLLTNYHSGLTSFGGPPVHFQIFHTKFVEKLQWIDEQTYQELFAICQALPGPASTKMLYSINVIRSGFGAGLLSLMLWTLPGAAGMYGLALGINQVSEILPPIVYAFLTGLNSGTVGVILLAAVQLSEKGITDKLTRIILSVAGAAGMLYTALWYFPVLMVAGGFATLVYDLKWLHPYWPWKKQEDVERAPEQEQQMQELDITRHSSRTSHDLRSETASLRHVNRPPMPLDRASLDRQTSPEEVSTPDESARIVPTDMHSQMVSWKNGLYLLAAFLVSFITLMVLRGTLSAPPLALRLFTNMYLAGTIIFGGGPVVIPLLREYVVAEGWVSPRDFLLGLAIIQAFPGPNFNFAVYLGALTLTGSTSRMNGPTAAVALLGAILAALAIFAPGLWIMTGFMGLWRVLRTKRWMTALLRGVNAAAIGLVWTAVYKLSQIGFIDAEHSVGDSLGRDPWWVAVVAAAFVGGRWFGISAPVAIISSGILGLLWFGIVKT